MTYTQGQEDTATGQLWVYIGRKVKRGNAFDQAGLTNGQDFVVDLQNEAVSTTPASARPTARTTPRRSTSALTRRSTGTSPAAPRTRRPTARGLTLNRIEDGAFDPRHPEDFYFVTTEGGNGATAARDGGGLWRLSYDDVERPWEGGTLTLLLDGSEAPFLSKPDNVGFDRQGPPADPGGPGRQPAPRADRGVRREERRPRGARAVRPGPVHSRAQPGFITQDEESSGIIDASEFLGKGSFLFDAQVHKANPEADKVEYGQLMTLEVRELEGGVRRVAIASVNPHGHLHHRR